VSTAAAIPVASFPLGAHAYGDGSASFVVWSPESTAISIRLHGTGARTVELDPRERGYFAGVIEDVAPGTRYSILLPDGTELPDPASRSQPDGVHGPSAVESAAFDWQTQSWRQPELRDLVLYELHVGTFTREGTFDAAIERLPALHDLGITAVEIMPIAQFPGVRNWGYDGVFPFATQNSYGGPVALKRFVDAAHALDLNVILDVVYNHLGPEGNYLLGHGPYFTDTYHTPWGAALNFDEAGSDEVRRYFIDSALQWTDEFRIDGLRLDAIHAILDRAARPFLRELADAVHERAAEQDRTVILIGESDLGDPRVLRSERLGGLDLDAQWLDDFHHSLHTLLTGEEAGYYIDFGTLAHLARAFQHGFVYAGEYSRYRGRRHGAPAPDILPRQFVVYAQNHDQVGNRMHGDRLTGSITSARLRLAAAAVLLSPFTPMLFMGEEYGSRAPFPFFTDFDDRALIQAVRAGRKAEFASFSWDDEPPDPQSPTTFNSAVLDWDVRNDASHAPVLALHRRLIELRRTAAGVRSADAMSTDILDTSGAESPGDTAEGVIAILRRASEQSSLLLLNFASETARIDVPATGRGWRCVLDTESVAFGGAGSSIPDVLDPDGHRIELAQHSAVLLVHDED
jgi:maltooligosyltrehalose trehalohydrolase